MCNCFICNLISSFPSKCVESYDATEKHGLESNTTAQHTPYRQSPVTRSQHSPDRKLQLLGAWTHLLVPDEVLQLLQKTVIMCLS